MNWIDIEKELPELEENVLLWIENTGRGAYTGFLYSKKETKEGFHYEWKDDRYNEVFGVTHWASITEPKK